jgi:DNA repair exonuclease SbcCD ATPase subunit
MKDIALECDTNAILLKECQTSMKGLLDRQRSINSNNDKINLIQQEIEKIQKEISTLLQSSGDIKTAKVELNDLRDNKDIVTEKKLEYVEERTYNEVIGEMLKDTGIKTKVIKQYLPVMNRLINQYLQVLDFFVAFHLDESFNETIRSRHRDAFNYASFSEGEKQRIDLSLLFTWRQIAKMKNSASTNLLVLDETFDSSLDHDGIDNLTKILNTLEDGTNVFIISHKGDILENKFRSKIEFIKERNFSKIK